MYLRSPFVIIGMLLGALCLPFLGGCEERSSVGTSNASLPDEFKVGEAKFNNTCARCHGGEAKGTNQGPPLVHKYYEPNHHGDEAFYRAAANGVRAHHFSFGDMPALSGVTREDMKSIIPYVRWLQRQAGII